MYYIPSHVIPFCEKIKHNLGCYSLILKLSLNLLDAFMSDGEKGMSDLCTIHSYNSDQLINSQNGSL